MTKYRNRDKYGLLYKDILSLPRKHALRYAQSIMDGEILLDTMIQEPYPFSKQQLSKWHRLDWNVQFSKSPRSFQLFLQSLHPVGDLTAAYVQTKQVEYYNLALDFVVSWIKYSKIHLVLDFDISWVRDKRIQRIVRDNEYVWDEHALALRIENLLYFLLVGQEAGLLSRSLTEKTERVLEQHGEMITQPRHYLENENHGVYQDKALLYLGYALHRIDWLQLAEERLKRQWEFLFTDEGVCVENSYTYQRLNLLLFVEISRLLERQVSDFGKLLESQLKKAEDFMGYALLPNGLCPPFGDSLKNDYSPWQTISEGSVMEYACSKGGKGQAPLNQHAVYPKAGYFFGREHWHQEGFEDAVWTMFRSGYKSITHRHADDNSFILYAKGEDIFLDAGFYSHMYRDPVRRYVRSARGHNSVVIDGKDYDFQRRDLTALCGIASCHANESEGYSYVVGYNMLYCGICHIRHFLFFGTRVFLLDELFSANTHLYTQMYHCGRQIKVEHFNADTAVLSIGNSGYDAIVRQIGNPAKMSVVHGRIDGTIIGVASELPHEYYLVDVIQYDIQAKHAVFVTTIDIQEKNTQSINIRFDQNDWYMMLEERGNSTTVKLKTMQELNLPRFMLQNIEATQEKSCFHFCDLDEYDDQIEYAWYITDTGTKKRVKKTKYTDKSTFTHDFSSELPGEYAVRIFIRNKVTGKKASQIVSYVKHTGTDWIQEFCLKHDEIILLHEDFF